MSEHLVTELQELQRFFATDYAGWPDADVAGVLGRAAERITELETVLQQVDYRIRDLPSTAISRRLIAKAVNP